MSTIIVKVVEHPSVLRVTGSLSTPGAASGGVGAQDGAHERHGPNMVEAAPLEVAATHTAPWGKSWGAVTRDTINKLLIISKIEKQASQLQWHVPS